MCILASRLYIYLIYMCILVREYWVLYWMQNSPKYTHTNTHLSFVASFWSVCAEKLSPPSHSPSLVSLITSDTSCGTNHVFSMNVWTILKIPRCIHVHSYQSGIWMGRVGSQCFTLLAAIISVLVCLCVPWSYVVIPLTACGVLPRSLLVMLCGGAMIFVSHFTRLPWWVK